MTAVPAARGPSAVQAALVALLVAVMYLSLTPWTTLWDRDEARFARAAVEMARSGQYLYSTFNDEVRAQKPILIYWLMSLSVRAFGPTEFAVRFWSPIGLALAAFFTYAIGGRLLSRGAGMIAMLLVALTPLAAAEAVLATTDAVLLACFTGALAASVDLLTGGPPLRGGIALAAALTAGQLAKGPIGLVLPLLTTAAAVALAHRAQALRVRTLLAFLVAAVASVTIFALWIVRADAATGGRIATTVVRENVGRFLTPMEGHGGGLAAWIAFYPAVVLVGFLPWSALLPAAFRALHTRRAAMRLAWAIITAGVLVPVGFFTLAATKLPHYVLPAWPALALAVASLADMPIPGDTATRRWIRRGSGIVVAVAVMALAAIVAVALLIDAPVGWAAAAALTALLLAASIEGGRSLTVCDAGRYVRRLVPLMIAGEAVVALWLLPVAERLKPVPVIAAAIRQHQTTAAPVATYGFEEPTLYFYLDRNQIASLRSAPGVADWAEQPAAGVLVTTRAALAGVERRYGPLPVRTVATAAGMNVATGARVELIALERADRR